jgi:hypothetical protein
MSEVMVGRFQKRSGMSEVMVERFQKRLGMSEVMVERFQKRSGMSEVMVERFSPVVPWDRPAEVRDGAAPAATLHRTEARNAVGVAGAAFRVTNVGSERYLS